MGHFPFITYITTLLLGGEDEAAAAEGGKLRRTDEWGGIRTVSPRPQRPLLRTS